MTSSDIATLTENKINDIKCVINMLELWCNRREKINNFICKKWGCYEKAELWKIHGTWSCPCSLWERIIFLWVGQTGGCRENTEMGRWDGRNGLGRWDGCIVPKSCTEYFLSYYHIDRYDHTLLYWGRDGSGNCVRSFRYVYSDGGWNAFDPGTEQSAEAALYGLC